MTANDLIHKFFNHLWPLKDHRKVVKIHTAKQIHEQANFELPCASVSKRV